MRLVEKIKELWVTIPLRTKLSLLKLAIALVLFDLAVGDDFRDDLAFDFGYWFGGPYLGIDF